MELQTVGHDWATFIFTRCMCQTFNESGNNIGVNGLRASLVVQMEKNLPAVQETWVPSLGREDPLEEGMAIHSSTLAWKIPWVEEPGRLQSMGSQRVGHYWATSLSLLTFVRWRRTWQPTPVFLPGESQGRGSLVAAVYGVGHDWRDSAAAAANGLRASLVVQMEKNLPAMQETWVPSLGWEDPLEEGMATHSSILAWRIPIDRGAQWATVSPWGHKESDMTEWLSTAQKV